MTMYATSQINCGNCGAQNTMDVLMSTNIMGSADLDTRPPEMRRSTINTWINRCGHCDYCAPDLSQSEANVELLVLSPEYVAMLQKKAMPAKAREFLCWSMIAGQTGRPVQAAWACIHSAWVCDDAGALEVAAVCRAFALQATAVATAAKQPISQQSGAAEAIMADLLRRCGRFDEAVAVAEQGLLLDPEEFVMHTLRYQKKLSAVGDSRSHTVDDAYRAAPDWEVREALRKAGER